MSMQYIMPCLHRVVEQLVLKLLDPQDLLREVVQLLLVEDVVAQHGRGRAEAGATLLQVFVH